MQPDLSETQARLRNWYMWEKKLNGVRLGYPTKVNTQHTDNSGDEPDAEPGDADVVDKAIAAWVSEWNGHIRGRGTATFNVLKKALENRLKPRADQLSMASLAKHAKMTEGQFKEYLEDSERFTHWQLHPALMPRIYAAA